MSEILAKISSYNIFNYLFPGAVFVFAGDALNVFHVPSDNIILALLLYYFAGLTISRIGSVFIEPLLSRTGWIQTSSYRDFLRAEAKDSKLQVLLEVSNTYRTLASMFVCLVAAYAGKGLFDKLSVPDTVLKISGLVALTFLYLLSYRKQAHFIRQRVEHHK